MDIQVISVDPTTRRVSFGIKPKKITGIMKLVQIVVIALLNSPGKDVFRSADGGGLLELVGGNVDLDDSNATFGDVARRVKKTQSEIIGHQLTISDPPDEKLSEIQIVSITAGGAPDECDVGLRVINQVGQSFDILL